MHENRYSFHTRLHRSLGRGLLAAVLLLSGLSAVRTQVDGRPETREPIPQARSDALERIAPLDLDTVGSGELLWKSERGLLPLPVLGIEVDLTVTGIMTRGRLTQRFHNPTGEVIEALYVFPLPERAAVHAMEIRLGERRIVSVVQEKAEAKRTYETAKATGRKAALVDQRRPNLFTTAVANINPGETVAVVLDYFEEATYEDGSFSLRFPLTFTPRFVPPGCRDDGYRLASLDGSEGEPGPPELAAPFAVPRHPAVPRAELRVHLKPGFELQHLDSRSHAVEILESGGSIEIATRPRRIIADRDFLFSWRPALGRAPQAAAFVEEREGEHYALIMIVPPRAESEVGLGLPTETLFIIDVSGSMDGPSIAQAREALLASLARLRPEDRFNILKFNDGNEAFSPRFEQAEPEALERARQWIGALRAGGGTMIHPALMRGLQMMGDSRSAHAQRIVFLTDGAVGNEQEVLRSIVERLGQTRLHTIGIGQAPNAYLMRKMASLGRGMCEFIANSLEAEDRIDAFFERLDRPVMTDIEWQTEGIRIDDAYPRRLTDLHSGQPLYLSARIDATQKAGQLSLGGYSRDGWLSTGVAINENAQEGNGVAVRWARAKVGSLMDSLHEGADPGAVRAEVVEIGLEFNLVTAYTSLVAVDDRPTGLGASRLTRVATALPQGGTDGPLRRLLGAVLLAVGLSILLLLKLVRTR